MPLVELAVPFDEWGTPVDASGIMPFASEPTISLRAYEGGQTLVTIRPDSKAPFRIAWWLGESDTWSLGQRSSRIIPGGEAVWDAWWAQADTTLIRVLDEIDSDGTYDDVFDALLNGETTVGDEEPAVSLQISHRSLPKEIPSPAGFTIASGYEAFSNSFQVVFTPVDEDESDTIEMAWWYATDRKRRAWLNPNAGDLINQELYAAFMPVAAVERDRYDAATRIAEKWRDAHLLALVGMTAKGTRVVRR